MESLPEVAASSEVSSNKKVNVYYEKFKELEHLFVDGTIPEELLEIDDPL